MAEKYEKPSALAVYPTGLKEAPETYGSKIEGMIATDCGGACKCSGGGNPCACRC